MPVLSRPPWGWQEVVATYTLPTRGPDGRVTEKWKQTNLVTINSPISFSLAWAPATKVTKITCHRLVANDLLSALNLVKEKRLDNFLSESYGGCYADRAIRGTTDKLSMHAFGAALDFRVKTNAMGSDGDMKLEVVRIFHKNNFLWGGLFGATDSSRIDSMHFQRAYGA